MGANGAATNLARLPEVSRRSGLTDAFRYFAEGDRMDRAQSIALVRPGCRTVIMASRLRQPLPAEPVPDKQTPEIQTPEKQAVERQAEREKLREKP